MLPLCSPFLHQQCSLTLVLPEPDHCHDYFQHNQVLNNTSVMFLPLSLFIFFADYYEESYQRLCENPRTLCLTGNLYVLNVPFFQRIPAGRKSIIFLGGTLTLSRHHATQMFYSDSNYNLQFTWNFQEASWTVTHNLQPALIRTVAQQWHCSHLQQWLVKKYSVLYTSSPFS